MTNTRKTLKGLPDFSYGKWIDDGAAVLVKTPEEFDFSQCLKFLARSPLEPCHKVHNNSLHKLEKFGSRLVLLKIGCSQNNTIRIDLLTPHPGKSIRREVAGYVRQWFDLDTDLRPFYRMAAKDLILKNVVSKLYGLRILTIQDLFEATCWAIMGQQINLRFAYTLKRRFVETFGEKFTFHRRHYYRFPDPHKVSCLKVSDIRGLQFTARKSEYIIELAQKMKNGDLTREGLLRLHNFKAARKHLMRNRGIGRWTADYVSLRCLMDPEALPAADVGLQNAIKQQLDLRDKPKVEDIIQYSNSWEGWKAYATFYLWASLINPP